MRWSWLLAVLVTAVIALPVAPSWAESKCGPPPCVCDAQNRLTCDCKNVPGETLLLTSEGENALSRHLVRIYVNNCLGVHLANSSLAHMDELASVEFTNVANLTFVRDSFKLSPKASKTRIGLDNCDVDLLPSNVFHGEIEVISFKEVRIGQVLPFAFANLVNTETITLDHCDIRSIESLAFKKFECRVLHFIGGSLGADQVPSKAILDVEVTEGFMLDGVRMGSVSSFAFSLKRPNTVAVINCTIDNLASQAFDLTVRGTVILRNNTFGNLAFGPFLFIRTDADSKVPSTTNILNPKNLIFKDNVLGSFEAGSLVFDRKSFRVELSNVLVNRECDCDQIKLWKDQILNYTNTYSRLLPGAEEAANGLSNGDVIAAPFTLESGIDDPDAFFCLDEREPRSFVGYEGRNCSSMSGSMLAVVVSVSGLLGLLLVAAAAVVYFCRRRHREDQKRWISVPTTAPDVVSKTKNGVISREQTGGGGSSGNGASAGPVDSRITMVVPDGRLYRETEFHVIVEKAEPLTTEL